MPTVLGTLGVFAVVVALVEAEAKQGIRTLTMQERAILYPLTLALLYAAMWIGARAV